MEEESSKKEETACAKDLRQKCIWHHKTQIASKLAWLEQTVKYGRRWFREVLAVGADSIALEAIERTSVSYSE